MVKTKLHSLKIKDELQGRLSSNPKYLACSVLKNDSSLEFHRTRDPHGNEMSGVHPDDDDTFTDALPEFISLTDSDALSQHMDAKDVSGFESTEMLIHEKDLVHGKGLCGEIFYEAQGGDDLDFVSVIFSRSGSSSPVYNGIDTQVYSKASLTSS